MPTPPRRGDHVTLTAHTGRVDNRPLNGRTGVVTDNTAGRPPTCWVQLDGTGTVVPVFADETEPAAAP